MTYHPTHHTHFVKIRSLKTAPHFEHSTLPDQVSDAVVCRFSQIRLPQY